MIGSTVGSLLSCCWSRVLPSYLQIIWGLLIKHPDFPRYPRLPSNLWGPCRRRRAQPQPLRLLGGWQPPRGKTTARCQLQVPRKNFFQKNGGGFWVFFFFLRGRRLKKWPSGNQTLEVPKCFLSFFFKQVGCMMGSDVTGKMTGFFFLFEFSRASSFIPSIQG